MSAPLPKMLDEIAASDPWSLAPFDAQTIQTLRTAVQPMNAAQRLWLSGFLAGSANVTSVVTVEAGPVIESSLQRHGIENDASATTLRQHSMACVAFPTCGLAMAESERYLPSLISKLELTLRDLGLEREPITLRMSGCPNGCSRPYLAEIALVEKGPGKYNLYLGASANGDRLNALYQENIGEGQILSSVRQLLGRFAQERLPAERFGDFLIRVNIVPPMQAGLDFQRTLIAAMKTAAIG